MTADAAQRVAAIVIDLEGTVGSIGFVKDVLFPYARNRLRSFVLAHQGESDVANELRAIASESGAGDVEGLIDRLEFWSDEDCKVAPLKLLQGMIWAQGYATGELVSHLYEDAVAALYRWARLKLPVYVYSSGSVAAQKLYLAHTAFGDLTPLLAGYFDLSIGSKTVAGSYRLIAAAIAAPPAELLFLSDAQSELRSASEAGWRAVQVRREGSGGSFEPSIESFDELHGCTACRQSAVSRRKVPRLS